MKNFNLAKRRGFTLVELLVVIGIIGLLSSIILFSVSEVRKQARDKQRMTDLKQMELALELYKEAFGEYPKPDAGCYQAEKWHGWVNEVGWATWYVQCDRAAGEEWAAGLTPTFIPTLPTDPHSTWDPVGYQYIVSNDGDSYKLWIYNGFESLTIDDYDHEFARCPASCSGVIAHCALTHADFPVSPTVWKGPDSACW